MSHKTSKIKKYKIKEVLSQMSILFEDESGIEINKQMGRIITRERKATIQGFENLHNGRQIFGFLDMKGKLYYLIKQRKKTQECLESIQYIRETIKTKYIIIIWDGAGIHKSATVKKYCDENNIIPIIMPAYSPDLNPIELCWKDGKREFRRIQWEKGKTLEEKINNSLGKIAENENLVKRRIEKFLYKRMDI